MDRIIEKFAEKYAIDNPQAFLSANSAYTFSYLLIMLQTDLNNPQVTEKMKVSDFTKMAY